MGSSFFAVRVNVSNFLFLFGTIWVIIQNGNPLSRNYFKETTNENPIRQ